MKRLATLAAATLLLLATAPATMARAEAYYTVVCSDGNSYESVDAHAIEQGGKSGAIDNFSTKTPLGLSCHPEGPFQP
jgi:hypothetical protein